MNEFKLVDVLRYGLPGGIFLMVSGVVYPEVRQVVRIDGGLFEAAVLTGVAFVIGSVVQALHRAVIYPPIYRYFLVVYEEKRRPNFRDLKESYFPSQTEIDVTRARWKHAAKNQHIGETLAHWGSQAHFLYAATWAVLGGLFVPAVRWWPTNLKLGFLGLLVAMCFGSAAILHDRRLMLIDQAITRRAK